MMRARALLMIAVSLAVGGCRTYSGDEDSTQDFAFNIVQKAVVPMAGETRVDVPFTITIKNKTDAPVKVEHVGIQSFEAGDYQIPFRSRPFETVIAPGETKELEFWANAIVTDQLLGTTQPLTIRSMVDFSSSQGNRHEVFVRAVNDPIGFGLQKPIGGH
jgi:hypothetical protein